MKYKYIEKSYVFRTGDLLLPDKIVKILDQYIIGSDHSIVYINYWSVLHFISGIFVYLFLTRKWNNAIIIHTIWEMWQIAIGMTKYKTNRGIIDISMDTIVYMVGFLLTDQITREFEKKNE